MSLFLEKSWTYLKQYWKVILLVAGGVVGLLLLRKREMSFTKQLKKLQLARDEEIKKIIEAHEDERRRHEENMKKLKETLALVQQQYDDAKKVLDDKKKKQVTQLVKQYGDQPDELARQLSSLTGFNVIMPKENVDP
jgi:uncharacterized protein (DUF927 family)